VFLALPPVRLYANSIREQTYTIPEITDEGEEVSPLTLKLEVGYRNAKKFTKINEAVMPWVFRFKPTEVDVGTHIISLAVRDPKINKQAIQVPWTIEVLSFNKSDEAPRCPVIK
jgi:hypothetical protein